MLCLRFEPITMFYLCGSIADVTHTPQENPFFGPFKMQYYDPKTTYTKFMISYVHSVCSFSFLFFSFLFLSRTSYKLWSDVIYAEQYCYLNSNLTLKMATSQFHNLSFIAVYKCLNINNRSKERAQIRHQSHNLYDEQKTKKL